MSQVHMQEYEGESLQGYFERGVDESIEIVLVRGPLRYEVFSSTVLPRETHYAGEEETVYEELVAEYKVERVLRSDALSPGALFWLWKEPAYSFDAVRRAHEEGILESPIVLREKPSYPVEGDRRVLFLVPHANKSDDFAPLYGTRKEEGAGAAEEIERLLG